MNSNNQDKQNQLNSHQQAAFEAKQEAFLHLCYHVFKTNKKGAELLETLRDSLVFKATVADPEKSEKHAFYREGQNSVIKLLYHNIELYERVIERNAIKTAEANQ